MTHTYINEGNTEISPKTALIEYENECLELGYNPALPDLVAKARKELEAKFNEGASYDVLSTIKTKFLSMFRNDPRMDTFDWDNFSFYSAMGEKNYW